MKRLLHIVEALGAFFALAPTMTLADTNITSPVEKPRFFRYFPSATKALGLALCSVPFTWGTIIWLATR